MAVRRVRRIVRRIDPWTVLKLSIVFNAIAGLIFVLGTWVVWSLSLQRGIPDRLVEIFDRITLTLTIDGELYFRVIVLLAVVGAIVMTGLMTLAAVLYNLIADLVGGVEITVLEETYNPNPAGTRTVLRPVARSQPVPAAVAPAAPAEDPDETEATEEPSSEDERDGDVEGAEEEALPVPVAEADVSGNGLRPDAGAADESPEGAEDKADDVQDPVPTA
jgi:hypothetical protein